MIFISYSQTDSAFARSLVSQLSDQGHRIWIDYRNLNLAEPLVPQLAFAIGTADLFLVLSSPHARSSRWVQFELSVANAWRKSIQIIQV